MASDDKKVKADPAPKKEAAAKDKSAAGEAASKTEGGEVAAALSNYSRGKVRNRSAPPTRKTGTRFSRRRMQRRENDSSCDKKGPGANPGP
jgi:hypothetical protein